MDDVVCCVEVGLGVGGRVLRVWAVVLCWYGVEVWPNSVHLCGMGGLVGRTGVLPWSAAARLGGTRVLLGGMGVLLGGMCVLLGGSGVLLCRICVLPVAMCMLPGG